MQNSDITNLVAFFHAVGKLKDVQRSGWKLHKVDSPESVAEHSWRMAVIALVLAKQANLDAHKAVAFAVVHDLAESVVGDYMPNEVSAEQKQKEERDAMRQLCGAMGAAGQDLLALWDEYELQSAPEAKLVKNIDRLEMALQAKEYELTGKAKDLSVFVDSAEQFLQDSELAGLLQEIKNLKV